MSGQEICTPLKSIWVAFLYVDLKLRTPEKMGLKVPGKATGTQSSLITGLQPENTMATPAPLAAAKTGLGEGCGRVQRRQVLTLKKPLQPSQVRTP